MTNHLRQIFKRPSLKELPVTYEFSELMVPFEVVSSRGVQPK